MSNFHFPSFNADEEGLSVLPKTWKKRQNSLFHPSPNIASRSKVLAFFPDIFSPFSLSLFSSKFLQRGKGKIFRLSNFDLFWNVGGLKNLNREKKCEKWLLKIFHFLLILLAFTDGQFTEICNCLANFYSKFWKWAKDWESDS